MLLVRDFAQQPSLANMAEVEVSLTRANLPDSNNVNSSPCDVRPSAEIAQLAESDDGNENWTCGPFGKFSILMPKPVRLEDFISQVHTHEWVRLL
jgi:hypothetical protein